MVRCHDTGAGPFPCRGLREPRACPLVGPPIDLVVTIRAGTRRTPSRYEDGAICALRHRIPLVVAGVAGSQPFDRWSVETVERDSDLVAACEDAATGLLGEHGEAARQAAAGVLATAGRRGGVETRVGRRQGALHAEVTVPAANHEITGPIAARVIGALRRFDPFAAAVDVTVTEVATRPGLNETEDRGAAT